MLKFVYFAIFDLVSMYLVYRFINYIDKKNRKIARRIEKEYIEAYAEIWEKQYFERLAKEKRLEEYNKKEKAKNQQQKEDLKNIHVDDMEKFKKYYEDNMTIAEAKLKEEEENC